MQAMPMRTTLEAAVTDAPLPGIASTRYAEPAAYTVYHRLRVRVYQGTQLHWEVAQNTLPWLMPKQITPNPTMDIQTVHLR